MLVVLVLVLVVVLFGYCCCVYGGQLFVLTVPLVLLVVAVRNHKVRLLGRRCDFSESPSVVASHAGVHQQTRLFVTLYTLTLLPPFRRGPASDVSRQVRR